jgi:hypothetical protein
MSVTYTAGKPRERGRTYSGRSNPEKEAKLIQVGQIQRKRPKGRSNPEKEAKR